MSSTILLNLLSRLSVPGVITNGNLDCFEFFELEPTDVDCFFEPRDLAGESITALASNCNSFVVVIVLRVWNLEL